MTALAYPRAVVFQSLESWCITLHLDAQFASDVATTFPTQADAVRAACVWVHLQRHSRPSRRLPNFEVFEPKRKPKRTPDLATCPQCNRPTRKAALKAKDHPGTVTMGHKDGTCFACHKTGHKSGDETGNQAATAPVAAPVAAPRAPATASVVPKPKPPRPTKHAEYVPLSRMPAQSLPLPATHTTPIPTLIPAQPGSPVANLADIATQAAKTTILGSGPPSSFITGPTTTDPHDEVAANRRGVDAYLKRRGNRNGANQ
ncbi:hypothetical protein ACX80O_02265 [Arthrobacter sp. Hz1]